MQRALLDTRDRTKRETTVPTNCTWTVEVVEGKESLYTCTSYNAYTLYQDLPQIPVFDRMYMLFYVLDFSTVLHYCTADALNRLNAWFHTTVLFIDREEPVPVDDLPQLVGSLHRGLQGRLHRGTFEQQVKDGFHHFCLIVEMWWDWPKMWARVLWTWLLKFT